MEQQLEATLTKRVTHYFWFRVEGSNLFKLVTWMEKQMGRETGCPPGVQTHNVMYRTRIYR